MFCSSSEGLARDGLLAAILLRPGPDMIAIELREQRNDCDDVLWDWRVDEKGVVIDCGSRCSVFKMILPRFSAVCQGKKSASGVRS